MTTDADDDTAAAGPEGSSSEDDSSASVPVETDDSSADAAADSGSAVDDTSRVGEGASSETAESGTETANAATDDRYTRKQCVLLTGCSSGIGEATARAFLEENWQVVATARNTDNLTDLEEAGCHTLELDVTEPAQVARAVEQTVEIGGAIDCLVNNAGYAQLGPTEDISTGELQRQFDVNVYGPHRLTRAALPHMRAQGDGRIINLSSVLGRISVAGAGAYSGSKHALEAMSDALRSEVEEFGIDVVVVEPGPVKSAFSDRCDEEIPGERTPAYESLYEVFDDTQLIGGDGPFASDPEDVAAAIVHAGTCPEPPARYPVGPVAEYGLYARYLPDWLRDAGYRFIRKLV
ncbi:SDR family oxidoreductase [Halobacteria archaeon AArc-curdl1]|uniref:SDR family oxidoreductase n=1 Tax=Natronosalvus hydrolyticus TaxID=2979988 RepID=A0AAP2Z9A4_9EURY|nr:SDR family oxidoreductase [Halobacteria archaeon AArc-curdl1]